MSNLVLYRKYRPSTFSDIAGQEIIITTLKNEVQNKKFGHAFLFCGSRGTGKTSTARVFAKAINCLDPKKGEPCNECANCTAINEGRAIDLVEIDAASNTSVDNVRELIEGIRFAPTYLKYKVYIIDECHQMSKAALNALLKTLEEPPAHAVFILATTELHKVIPTILSRCQRFDFRKINAKDIADTLETIAQKEGIKITREALEVVAQNGQGSLRDAEVLLDQVRTFARKGEINPEDIKGILGLIDVKVIAKFFDFVLAKDSAGAVGFLAEIMDNGYDPNEFANDAIDYLRQAMLLKIDKRSFEPLMANFSKEDLLKLNEQISKLQSVQIVELINLFLEARNQIKFSPIAQLPIELAVVKFSY